MTGFEVMRVERSGLFVNYSILFVRALCSKRGREEIQTVHFFLKNRSNSELYQVPQVWSNSEVSVTVLFGLSSSSTCSVMKHG